MQKTTEAAEALEAFKAFLAFKRFTARTMQRWVYNAKGDDKTCDDCDSQDGQTFVVADVWDLLDIFPYGEPQSSDLFWPNTHPNCRCEIILLETYWED